MRLDKYLASLFAAGMLLGSPNKGVADEFFSAPTDSTESAAEGQNLRMRQSWLFLSRWSQ